MDGGAARTLPVQMCSAHPTTVDPTGGQPYGRHDRVEQEQSRGRGEATQMDEHQTVGEHEPSGFMVDSSLEHINHDQLLDGMLEGDVPPEVETKEIEATQTRLVQAVQMTLPGLVTNPVTVIDHAQGRAVRQASLAPKTSWRAGRHQGSQTQRLYYVADNGIEIALGTPENPLDLEEAKKQIKRAGELTVLIDRLLFWFWLSRSRPRPGDGKTFVSRNGSVPVSIEEMLALLGYKKHTKREGNQRYSDGYRTEDKDRLTWNIALLAAFQVSSAAESGFGIQGAYLRYSLGFWDDVHVGYLISPGDWINTITLPDQVPGLMSIDQQIFQLDCQAQQHEIRLCLYLAEAFRDQFRQGTLGEPLRVPMEGHAGRTRLITMEELLRDAQIKIDRNNLTQRFVPRIEEALATLVRMGIVARAEPAPPIDKTTGYWGKAWCNAPMIVQAPERLVNEYRTLSPVIPPPLLPGPKGRRRSKSKA
jgi:hypothetical protein